MAPTLFFYLVDSSTLLFLRKFRDKANKAGAVRGFEVLEKEGLGGLISTKLRRGANMVNAVSEPVHVLNNCMPIIVLLNVTLVL